MKDRVERINKIIDYLGITRNVLANTSGLASSNVSKMMSGEQVITDKTLYKIVDAYPQFNIEWLKTGEGEMIKPGTAVNQNGATNVYQDGHAGHDLTQTNNSEKILSEFIEGLKSQNSITEKAMCQTELSMAQTNRAMEQTDKTLAELSEQRKLVDRLITIIENKNS